MQANNELVTLIFRIHFEAVLIVEIFCSARLKMYVKHVMYVFCIYSMDAHNNIHIWNSPPQAHWFYWYRAEGDQALYETVILVPWFLSYEKCMLCSIFGLEMTQVEQEANTTLPFFPACKSCNLCREIHPSFKLCFCHLAIHLVTVCVAHDIQMMSAMMIDKVCLFFLY